MNRRRHCLCFALCAAWLLLAVAVMPRGLIAAELHDAVRAQDNAQLEQALKVHPEFVDVRDADGRTALHLAAAAGQLEAVKLLVAYGAAVNATDRAGRTPLQLAQAAHANPVIEYLQQHGAGEVNFSRVNDSVLSGFTWCIFAGIALFGLLVFFYIVTKKKKSPDELLADELNDQ